MMQKIIKYWLVLLFLSPCVSAQTIVEQGLSEVLKQNSDGKLLYSEDAKGNRLPDFSFVGYHFGEKTLPEVSVKITLQAESGDNTNRIQNALDKLGKLPADKNGHRGALVLKKGIYRVEGTLFLKHSGVVLRGEGSDPNGTIIVAAGYDDFKYKRTLIEVGNSNEIEIDRNSKQKITNDYVPVGTHSFSVQSADSFKVGDHIVVFRPSTKEWISFIGCDKLEPRWAGIRDVEWIRNDDVQRENVSSLTTTKAEQAKEKQIPGFYYQRLGYDQLYFMPQHENESWEDFRKRIPISEDETKFDFTRQWQPGEYDLYFERRITAIKGNKITIDAPIVHALEKEFGGGAIFHFKTNDRITEVGIENLRLISEFAEPTPENPYGNPVRETESEQHAWYGIRLNINSENTWVRNVTGNYFGWSLVSAYGKKATVQDCVNLGHASKIDGGRRYPFMINGQLNLVQRCIAFEGRHEFVAQQQTLGPNVFVDCIGFDSKHHVGPHHRYAVGTLFDNIKSEKPMESYFRGNWGTGHGWAGTQTCFYNCIAPDFLVEAPPGGISWCLGSGKKFDTEVRLKPVSLYYQQLQNRLVKKVLKNQLNQKDLSEVGQFNWVEKRLKEEKIN